MFYLYVLQSLLDKRLYTGCTNDLKQRLSEHNAGRVLSTKLRRPWKLIYYEAGLNEIDAFRREKYIKSGTGKKYLKSRLKIWLLNEPCLGPKQVSEVTKQTENKV